MRSLLFTIVLLTSSIAASTPREKAETLLHRWCDGLIAVQLGESSRPELKGGILCPACGFLHGRIGDVVSPFVYLYATTGERKYLTAAENAVDWCEANMLLPCGLYRNDRQSLWRSTTAFFAIPLWKTLHDDGARLPPATRAKWQAIFRRAAAALYDLYEDGFKPVINYHCVYPELMFLAWKETGKRKYLDAARRKADFIRANAFDEEGFLIGEGYGPPDGNFFRSARGCRFVDLGYNLEESLTALVEYADLAGDADLRAKAVSSARLQLGFVLPDGAIDDSCGSRSVKWTYYGSRTSDGILPLLCGLRDDLPYAAKLADRVLDLYARCTGTDGLLAGGLMYAEADEPSCVHHTFSRAKTLVTYLRSDLPERDAAVGELPRAAGDGARHYAALDAWLASVGPWCATVSAYDAFNLRREAAVSGGAMSLLWHRKAGPVFVGTLGSFFYAEAHNMQDDRHDMDMQCLTPRIVRGTASNVFDYESVLRGNFTNGVFSASAAGRLTTPRGEKGEGFSIAYRLAAEELTIRIDAVSGARYVIPLAAGKSDRVCVDGTKVTIRRGNATVTLAADVPVALDACRRGDRIWSPVTGLLCVPLSVSLETPVTLKLRCE